MNSRSYLRAYLAGVFIPTLILPVMLSAFIVLRLVLKVPVPIERGLVFPMALVPAGWGLWNMLWLASHERTRLAVSVHGAVLPFLLVPIGAVVGRCLGVLELSATGVTWFQVCHVPYAYIALGLLIAVAVYYLVWKYIIGLVNREFGIA